MLQGFVAGEVWSSSQVPALAGTKLLLVQPETANETQQELVAVDVVGAGVGDRVLVALGRAARNALGQPEAPIEAAIIAVIDDLKRELPREGTRRSGADQQPESRSLPKKPSLKKKPRKRTVDVGDETLDLFSGVGAESPEEQASASLRVQEILTDDGPSDMPSIDDVDRIWGDETEEEEESTS